MTGNKVDSRMESAKLFCAVNWRKAAAVVAKPSGTRTPAWARLRMSSPREAFFPPTSGASASETPDKGRMRGGSLAWRGDFTRFWGGNNGLKKCNIFLKSGKQAL